VLAGKKRMGAERAEGNGECVLGTSSFVIFLIFFGFIVRSFVSFFFLVIFPNL